MVALIIVLLSLSVFASEEKIIRIHHDADWSNNRSSAEAIWRGMYTAFSEVDFNIQGYSIELVKKDHRGNVFRSKKNLDDFVKDSKGLAVMGGMHSPPLIKYRDFINENNILMLVPWAAGAPITRYPSINNWIFRLSIDDAKAGHYLVDFALNQKQCQSPHLLLESTAWGDSNYKAMHAALSEKGIKNIQTTRFYLNIKEFAAKEIIKEITDARSDCILLVAGSVEGAQLVLAVNNAGFNKKIPIISHWGISGGDFEKAIGHKIRSNLDLTFIQTCFSFMSNKWSAKAAQVFDRARKNFPDDINKPADITSPVGFIHSYDLTMLFIAALNQIELSHDMANNKKILRNQLQALEGEHQGLVKRYKTPFLAYSNDKKSAHEALSSNDYCMASYGANHSIYLIKQEKLND